MKELKTLKEYLYPEGKKFTIPNYQRGYKWAIKESEQEPSAVEKLVSNLISAFEKSEQNYFLQGVTVNDESNNITLIDGQQRTTTLYLLLWSIDKEYIKDININYEIREDSSEFLNDLKKIDSIPKNENLDNQDIHYFKEAIKQIKQMLGNKINNKKDFYEFICNKTNILYIDIPKSKATKIFTMMNGNKAEMLPEELIKAEMLRVISDSPDFVDISEEQDINKLHHHYANEWKLNALRSRYAREWDKWLYWWNKKDVQNFFDISSPMGLLLEYYYKRNTKKNDFNFNNFRILIDENSEKTKLHFKKLRDLQKSFEDIFDIPNIFNCLGLVLKGDGKKLKEDRKFEVINYFIDKYKEQSENLEKYAKWSLIEANHSDIISPESDKLTTIAYTALDYLSGNCYFVPEAKELAFKQLLRLNVKEDDNLKRKFDFNVCEIGNRSLEHIHAKSKEDMLELSQDDEWTIHSIGNLLLLYYDDNRDFGTKPFKDKRKLYFDLKGKLKSRNLLHTISVFANETWEKKDIEQNKTKFITRFKEDYNLEGR